MAGLAACGLAWLGAVQAGELAEPPVFSAGKHSKTLDLLVIAKPVPIAVLPGATGWGTQ